MQPCLTPLEYLKDLVLHWPSLTVAVSLILNINL